VDQILYDQSGAFECILRTNANGTQIQFTPGSDLWADYVAQNGVPPATGTPTFKPARIAKQVHAVFLALQGLNLTAAQINQGMLAVTAFLLVNGGTFTGGQLYAYLVQEFPAINWPTGDQLNP
jgi:hypothetical protein